MTLYIPNIRTIYPSLLESEPSRCESGIPGILDLTREPHAFYLELRAVKRIVRNVFAVLDFLVEFEDAEGQTWFMTLEGHQSIWCTVFRGSIAAVVARQRECTMAVTDPREVLHILEALVVAPDITHLIQTSVRAYVENQG